MDTTDNDRTESVASPPSAWNTNSLTDGGLSHPPAQPGLAERTGPAERAERTERDEFWAENDDDAERGPEADATTWCMIVWHCVLGAGCVAAMALVLYAMGATLRSPDYAHDSEL